MPTISPVLLSHAITASVCAWLLTYAVHSTVALGVVWACSRRAPPRAHALREGLWKSGLLIGLVTATLQVGLGTAPGGGFGVLEHQRSFDRLDAGAQVSLPRVSEPATGEVCAFEVQPGAMPFPEREASDRKRDSCESRAAPRLESGIASENTSDPATLIPLSVPSAPMDAGGTVPAWAAWFVGMWLCVAALLTGRHMWLRRRLHMLLKSRRPLLSGPLPAVLETLASDAGLRRAPALTTSAHLPGPIAVSRREICIPQRALEELGPREQEGMLAHELAHIVRRDHDWLRLGLFLENVLFFQPLHRIARRRLQEHSEYLCDAWAVGRTGGDVALARCLAEVAGWVSSAPRLAVPGMAPRGSTLVRRVQSLLSPDSGSLRRLPRFAAVPLILGLIAVGTWIVPGITPSAATPAPRGVIEIADHGRVLLLPRVGTVLVAGNGRLQLQEGGRTLALPRGCVLSIDGSAPHGDTRGVGAGATIRVLDERRREAWRIVLVEDDALRRATKLRARIKRPCFLFEIRDGALSRSSWGGDGIAAAQILQLGDSIWFLDDHGRPLVDLHGGTGLADERRRPMPLVEAGFLGGAKGGERMRRSAHDRGSKGLHVARVFPDSPAARAGLEPYDTIVKACGVRVRHGADLDRVLRNKQPGDRLVLLVKRQERKLELSMRVRALDTTRVVRHAAAAVCVETWRSIHRRERDAKDNDDHLERRKARHQRDELTRHVREHVGLKLWEALLANPELRVF